jgi:hypothetical protein
MTEFLCQLKIGIATRANHKGIEGPQSPVFARNSNVRSWRMVPIRLAAEVQY